MTIELEIESIRDQVLRKIGRNVVNVQKMEAMLKMLNTRQAITGSLQDIEKIMARARKSLSKKSMGQLAEAFIRSAYSSTQGENAPCDVEKVSVSFSFRMELEPALVTQRKKALRSVVSERNNLIHKWLGTFDPNSLEGCRALEVKLDEQHERIWPEFETLRGIVQAVREFDREAAQYFNSESFLTELIRVSKQPKSPRK